MGKGIQKEETYSKYGDDAREIEIESLEKHGTYIRVGISEIPECRAVMEGGFLCTVKNESLTYGYKKRDLTSAIKENRCSSLRKWRPGIPPRAVRLRIRRNYRSYGRCYISFPIWGRSYGFVARLFKSWPRAREIYAKPPLAMET